MKIYKANKVLILGLKRFHEGFKNNTRVKIPLELNPQDIITRKDDEQYKGKQYKLYALLLHLGGLKGGHYKAICRNSEQKCWMEYDDSYVRTCSLNSYYEEDVYGIFYQLVSKKEQDIVETRKDFECKTQKVKVK